MGMNSEGDLRRITETEPLRPDEVLIAQERYDEVAGMTRQQRRALHRKEMKHQRKERANDTTR